MFAVELLVSADSGTYELHLEIDVSSTGDKRRTVTLPKHGMWIFSSSEECQPLSGSRGS